MAPFLCSPTDSYPELSAAAICGQRRGLHAPLELTAQWSRQESHQTPEVLWWKCAQAVQAQGKSSSLYLTVIPDSYSFIHLVLVPRTWPLCGPQNSKHQLACSVSEKQHRTPHPDLWNYTLCFNKIPGSKFCSMIKTPHTCWGRAPHTRTRVCSWKSEQRARPLSVSTRMTS